jgi:hypothetical protein
MTTPKTSTTTDKYFLASWEDVGGHGFCTPPILFREEECAKVEAILIFAGMENVVMMEAKA